MFSCLYSLNHGKHAHKQNKREYSGTHQRNVQTSMVNNNNAISAMLILIIIILLRYGDVVTSPPLCYSMPGTPSGTARHYLVCTRLYAVY